MKYLKLVTKSHVMLANVFNGALDKRESRIGLIKYNKAIDKHVRICDLVISCLLVHVQD